MRRLWLNDFELNNPELRVQLREPIEGLEIPRVRTSSGANTGQHGRYIGAQQYDSRAVTINGSIFSSNVAEALQKRREIQRHLPIHPESITVRVEDDDGSRYIFEAYLIDFKMPINRTSMKSIFKIELEAPNPVIFDDDAGAALSATINQLVPGGFQFTDTSPQFGVSFYFSAGQASSTVTNDTEVPSYPVITITGKITNPVLTNRTTGESFRLENYAVGAGSVTVIGMAEQTVRLNGGNAFAYAPADVDWWALVAGDNDIEFTSGAGGDVTSAEITWRPGYWGI